MLTRLRQVLFWVVGGVVATNSAIAAEPGTTNDDPLGLRPGAECMLSILRMTPDVEDANLVVPSNPSSVYDFDGQIGYRYPYLEYRFRGTTIHFSISKNSVGSRYSYTFFTLFNGLLRGGYVYRNGHLEVDDYGIGDLTTKAQVQCDSDVIAISG